MKTCKYCGQQYVGRMGKRMCDDCAARKRKETRKRYDLRTRIFRKRNIDCWDDSPELFFALEHRDHSWLSRRAYAEMVSQGSSDH